MTSRHHHHLQKCIGRCGEGRGSVNKITVQASSLRRRLRLDPIGTKTGKAQQQQGQGRTQMVIVHLLLVLISCSPTVVVATAASSSASASSACFVGPWGVDATVKASSWGFFDSSVVLAPAPCLNWSPSAGLFPRGRDSQLVTRERGWLEKKKPYLERRLAHGSSGGHPAEEGVTVDEEWNSDVIDGLDGQEVRADGIEGLEPERKGRRRLLVLVRHGCTYMNEYLSTPGTRWGDPTFRDDWSFRDSPLSERGILQAEMLRRRLSPSSADVDRGGDKESEEDEELAVLREALNEVRLVAVSPLTRALQTFELALLPYLGLGHHDDDAVDGEGGEVPAVVALPIAAERVYLSSDIGTPVDILKPSFPRVDFESQFHHNSTDNDQWWGSWEYDEVDGAVDGSYKAEGTEEEWRPHGQGQIYVCRGEPEHAFHDRMVRLHEWLTSRSTWEDGGTVALVAHWGVLQWLCGHDFANCEARVVDVDLDLRPEGFALGDEEEEELFAAGERSVVGVSIDVDVDVGDESLVP